MRILITGGAGFIGRNCAARLIHLGHSVICVDNLSAVSVIPPPSGLRRTDVRNLASEDLDVDAILHLAALKHVPDSFLETDQILHNISVDHHILRIFSESTRPQRLVMASSCEVYGNQGRPASELLSPNPRSPYAVGKVAMEHLSSVYRAMSPEKQICVLRLHNIFGPDEGGNAVISSFIDSILSERPLKIEGDGSQARDFTYVEEACEMIFNVLLDPKLPVDTLNIGSGTATSIAELAEILAEIVGDSLSMESGDVRLNEIEAFTADMTLYRSRYGQVPTRPLRDGLRSSLTQRTAVKGIALETDDHLPTAFDKLVEGSR